MTWGSLVTNILLTSLTPRGGSGQSAVPAAVLNRNRGALVCFREGGEVVHEVVDHLRMGELLEGAIEEDSQIGVGVPTLALGVRQETQLLRCLTLEQATDTAGARLH